MVRFLPGFRITLFDGGLRTLCRMKIAAINKEIQAGSLCHQASQELLNCRGDKKEFFKKRVSFLGG
jgi:hypothetical protein